MSYPIQSQGRGLHTLYEWMYLAHFVKRANQDPTGLDKVGDFSLNHVKGRRRGDIFHCGYYWIL